MYKKILEYAGEHRKGTYASIAVMLAGVAMSVIPYWFIYQIIAPLLTRQELHISDVLWRILGIAVCLILYAFLYVKGLSLSH